MTKNHRELLRLTRPIRFRTLRKMGMYMCDLFRVVKSRVKYTWLDLFTFLKVYKHQKSQEITEGKPFLLGKIGYVDTKNIRLEIHLNKVEKKVVNFDRYLKKDKIICDDTTENMEVIYNSFPTHIYFRVDENEPYKKCEGYLDNHIFRLPVRELNEVATKELNGITIYEEYIFNPTALQRLNFRYVRDFELSKEEIERWEEDLKKMVLEEFEGYMKNSFKMSQCLVRKK